MTLEFLLKKSCNSGTDSFKLVNEVSESRSLWYCILTFYDWLDNLTPLS